MSGRRPTRFPGRVLMFGLGLASLAADLVRRRKKPPELRRILVAHHLMLGDTLMLTGLLAKLREQHPQATIAMTTPIEFLGLYEQRPYGVVPLPYDERHPWTFTRLWREPRFDLAVLPADNRYSWLCRAIGARWIVAFGGDRPAWKNWPVDEMRPYSTVPTAFSDTAAEIVDGRAPQPFETSRWPAPRFGPFEFPREPYAVLHVGASTILKHWEVEKWRELAGALVERGMTPVWSSGPGEEGLVAAIDPERRYPSLAGRLDLAQMWALLARARLLVAPDTGIPHLARIVGVPTVTLFGPGSALVCGAGDFWRNAPYRAVTIDPFPCRDQNVQYYRTITWMRRCDRVPPACERPRCMEAIAVDAVLRAIDEFGDVPRTQSRGSNGRPT